MKSSHKAAAILAAVTLGVSAAVIAHPGQGQMGGGMGMHGKAGMHQGMRGAAQQSMTPEERRKLAEANRAEMHKRAQEKSTESNTHSH